MNAKFLSPNLVRVLIIIALVIPLALGAVSPARATQIYTVTAWGNNSYNQTDIPSGLTDVVAIEAGSGYSLALKSDRTVVGWGYSPLGNPTGLSDVVALEAGPVHALAIKSDGSIVGWGSNMYGEITIPAGLTAIDVAAGEHNTLVVKPDGTVTGWGYNGYGQISIPSLTNAVDVDMGWNHTLALKSDGTVVGWGQDTYGQRSIPPGLTNVVAIAAGGLHSLALKSDGTVVGWGYNAFGQTDVPSDLSDVIAIEAGSYHSLALKSDGTVVGWGHNGSGQINIPANLTGVTAISAGGAHNLALVPFTNTVPTANPGGPYLGAANTAISFDGSLSSDPENDPLTYAWDFGDGATGTGSALTHTYAAVGVYNACLMVNDGSLSSAQACTQVVVSQVNTAPIATPGGPYLGAVNTAIAFDGSLSSDPENDPLTYTWDFGDGSGTGTGSAPTHSYTAAGIYTVCLTVNDGSLNSNPACTLAVVYDPSAGFVTGGGWITSPAGAYKADESLAGKATFGFMAKYQKGASVPTGNTAFQFDLAGLSFASQSYDWLVVNQSGTNAQFKGTGMVNGALDPDGHAYKFMLWAGDGSPDTLRIRIWWENAAGVTVDVYDNGVAQAIGAGNIVVHTSK